MPKIPEFTGGPNIGPRSVVGVDAGGGGSEGSAIANFGKTFSNVVGRVAADIERTNNELNYQELRTDLQKMIKDSANSLRERQEGQAEDGSDVVANAKNAFKSAHDEVMNRARSSAVKRRLAGFADQLGTAFEEDAINIAQRRLNGFVKDKSLELSRNEAAEVIDNPEYLESSINNFSEYLKNQEAAISADDAKKMMKSHKALLRGAMEKHYVETNDGAGLEELQRAISGTSDNQAANELFSDMDGLSKKAAMSKVESYITRRDLSVAQDIQDQRQDFAARMAIGEQASPEELTSMISKVRRLKIDDKKKVKLVDSIKGQQIAARAISGVKDGAMAKLNSMMQDPYSFIKDASISARVKQEAASQIQKAADARVRALSKDSAGTFLAEDTLLKNKLDSAVKSEGGFYDFAFSDYPETDEGKAERSAAIDRFKDYRKTMKAKHAAMGLTYTPISKAHAMQIATQMKSMSATQATAYIGDISEAFGEDAQQMANYIRASVGKDLGQIISAMFATASLSSSARLSMAESYKNDILDDKKAYEAALGSRESVAYSKVSDLESDVDAQFSKVSNYFLGSNGGEAMQAALMDAVKLEAKKLNLRGDKNPVENAYKNIMESSFETIEVGNSTILRTRNTPGGKKKASQEDLQAVLGAASRLENLKDANLMVPEPFKESIRSGKVSVRGLFGRIPEGFDVSDFFFADQSKFSDEQLDILFRAHVANNGRWKDDGTGSGYKLMVDMGVGPLGEVIQLDEGNEQGRPFTIKDSEIVAYGEDSLGIELPSKEVPFMQQTMKFISNGLRRQGFNNTFSNRLRNTRRMD